MNREPAWRVFATEYNNSGYEIKGEEQKTPSYIVTPLGAKINRLYITGVLTDVENIAENQDFIRAHISDPTGVYTLYSGQYQPETTQILTNIEVPAYVAVIGKTRTYSPEEGELILSIRPEIIREITPDLRDRWILNTIQHTKQRLDILKEAQQMTTPTSKELKSLGCPSRLAEGVLLALDYYKTFDISRYLTILHDAVEYVYPKETTNTTQPSTTTPSKPETQSDTSKKKKNHALKNEDSKEETEELVIKTIKNIEGENGAAWDLIIEECIKNGVDETDVEEALTSLMDKGFIFEPILGTIKST